MCFRHYPFILGREKKQLDAEKVEVKEEFDDNVRRTHLIMSREKFNLCASFKAKATSCRDPFRDVG